MARLKIHCIAEFDGKDGTAACGEPFFASSRSAPSLGQFQAVRRIGGLVAYPIEKFEYDYHSYCNKCVDSMLRGQDVFT